MLSSRPVRPLVPTPVEVPSSSDTKNCDQPAGDAEARHEKRDAAAARRQKLFTGNHPRVRKTSRPDPLLHRTNRFHCRVRLRLLNEAGLPVVVDQGEGATERRREVTAAVLQQKQTVSGSYATHSTSTAERPKPRSKKERFGWSTEPECLALAVDACKNGLSVHEAGRMLECLSPCCKGASQEVSTPTQASGQNQ